MPMFSQSASSNPMIVPSDDELTIKLADKNNASIVIDGYTDDEIEESLRIIISQQDHSYELIHPLNYDYFEACRTKLSWGNPLVNIRDKINKLFNNIAVRSLAVSQDFSQYRSS